MADSTLKAGIFAPEEGGNRLAADGMELGLRGLVLKTYNMKKVLTLLLCLLVTMGVGGLSGYLTSPEISGWYAGLDKPSFNPPNNVFGPVWTILYFLMGVSLYLIVISPSARKKFAIGIFVTQLILNFFWSIIFFNLHQIGLALIEIILLWMMILAMVIAFYKINRVAGLLQVPYLLWVSFATVLNAAIYQLNG